MDGPGPITRFLAGDHERLDALLQAALTPAGEIDLASYEQFRAGLLRHIGIEEKILVPASRRASGGAPHPTYPRLHRDHGALALLLIPTPTKEILEDIRALLAEHNEIEERAGGIYEACDRLLGDDLGTVLEKLKAYPPVKLAPHFDGPQVPRRAADALRIVSQDD